MTKIIALEGLDCSFKETNSKRLEEFLIASGYSVGRFSFPAYDRESSYFVRKMLSGAYGDPSKMDPELCSMFYALDRYDYYVSEIKPIEDKLDYIIFDRYTGSNMIYQASKYYLPYLRKKACGDIAEFEYVYCDLPRPNINIFLKVPYEVSVELMSKKEGHDAHETNKEYQKKVYDTADEIITNRDWEVVECTENNELLSQDKIFSRLMRVLWKNNIINDDLALLYFQNSVNDMIGLLQGYKSKLIEEANTNEE